MQATVNDLHPFEAVGLGLAPFRYVGMEEKVGPITLDNGVQVGSPGQPMGTCDYCGQGIAYCVGVESADGKRFVIGMDCAEKLYRDSNRTSTATARDPIYQAIARDRKAHQRKIRHAREAKKIAEGKQWCDAHREQLAALPHPNQHRAAAGDSFADYLDWMFRMAGTSGTLSAIHRARAAMQEAT